jgi:hypothetical protein
MVSANAPVRINKYPARIIQTNPLPSAERQIQQQRNSQRPQHYPFTAEKRFQARDSIRELAEKRNEYILQPLQPEYIFQKLGQWGVNPLKALGEIPKSDGNSQEE